MSEINYLYKEKFPKGSTVKIVQRALLEIFSKTWKPHHELEPNQLNYADQIAEVKSVGFYHGRDVLYELEGVPGIWHEQCLEIRPQSQR